MRKSIILLSILLIGFAFVLSACSTDKVGSATGLLGCKPKCVLPKTCVDNKCVCTPKCAGKTCGPDGCGGVCGKCIAPKTCNAKGQCSCTPKTCLQMGWKCGSGVETNCKTSIVCGTCKTGQKCVANKCCTPSCKGKTCGDDGCGGTCGTCKIPNTCKNGICVKLSPPCGNYGDVDSDGYVTETDAAIVSKNVGNLLWPLKKRADVDGNGDVSFKDSIAINDYATGKISTFPICTANARSPPCGNYGDVDSDGYVTATDATIVSKNVGNSAWPEDKKKRADIDGNGDVSFKDSIAINDYATYKIDTFPICTACTDSDGGKDYFVKGTTIGLAANDVMTTRVDSCWPNNYYKDGYDYVAEWFCSNNTGTGKTYAINTNEKCLNGCNDGACIPPAQPTCEDMSCDYANYISGFIARGYDVNSNNIIDLDESLKAIVDWSKGSMSKDEVCGLVNLWKNNCPIQPICKDMTCGYANNISGFIARGYDINSNNIIDSKEVLTAIADWNKGSMPSLEVCGLVNLWKNNCPIQPICKDMTCEEANRISNSKAIKYDADSNNIINSKEVLTAIADWSKGLMSNDEVCGMVNLWKSSCPILTYSCKENQLIGDINNDGSVNVIDRQIIERMIAGIIPLPSNRCCADLNSDGSINAIDYTKIDLILSGSEKPISRCAAI